MKWITREKGASKQSWIVYDALYVYCGEMLKRGRPNGDFMD